MLSVYLLSSTKIIEFHFITRSYNEVMMVDKNTETEPNVPSPLIPLRKSIRNIDDNEKENVKVEIRSDNWDDSEDEDWESRIFANPKSDPKCDIWKHIFGNLKDEDENNLDFLQKNPVLVGLALRARAIEILNKVGKGYFEPFRSCQLIYLIFLHCNWRHFYKYMYV